MFVGQGHALAGDLAVPDHIARQGDKWYEYGPQIHRICDGGGQPAALHMVCNITNMLGYAK